MRIFFYIRTGTLDYLRTGFPWPARPFKHTESKSFKHVAYGNYIQIYELVFHTTFRAKPVWPTLHIFKCRYRIIIISQSNFIIELQPFGIHAPCLPSHRRAKPPNSLSCFRKCRCHQLSWSAWLRIHPKQNLHIQLPRFFHVFSICGSWFILSDINLEYLRIPPPGYFRKIQLKFAELGN
jgi:hypothetical protein